MRPVLIAVSGAALLMAGCSNRALRPATAASAPAAVETREAATVYVERGRCSGAGVKAELVFAPIVGAVAGIAVDTLINAISGELKRAKEARNAAWSASAAATLPNGDYCLAVSRGVMTKGGTSDALPGGLGFADYPAFVMRAEMTIAHPDDKKIAVTVQPLSMDYAETAAPSRGTRKKDVRVIISIAANAPPPSTTAPDKPADGVIWLDFGRLEIGKSYDATLLKTISGAGSIAVAANDTYTVTALVTESEDPNLVLTALSAAFDSGKGDLAKALKDALGGGK